MHPDQVPVIASRMLVSRHKVKLAFYEWLQSVLKSPDFQTKGWYHCPHFKTKHGERVTTSVNIAVIVNQSGGTVYLKGSHVYGNRKR